VHDVEPARRERDGEVRAHAYRNAHLAAPRDRHRRAERDELGVEAGGEGAAARSEVARTIRRREHRDAVTARA